MLWLARAPLLLLLPLLLMLFLRLLLTLLWLQWRCQPNGSRCWHGGGRGGRGPSGWLWPADTRCTGEAASVCMGPGHSCSLVVICCVVGFQSAVIERRKPPEALLRLPGPEHTRTPPRSGGGCRHQPWAACAACQRSRLHALHVWMMPNGVQRWERKQKLFAVFNWL
jgi:hypothetical protein